METNRNFKTGIFIVIVLIVYTLYTRPAKLSLCMTPDKVEMMYVSIDSYKDGFSQRNEQTTFIKEIVKIEPVLEFLNQYSFRKKIHNPHQAVGAGQKDTVRIMFHYKNRNDVLDIDIFEIGNEGKIRIVQSLHGGYAPYTIGWIGKKQEKALHKDLSELLNNLFKNDFEYKVTNPFDIVTHLEEDWGKSYDDYIKLEAQYDHIQFAYDGMLISIR